MNIGLIAHDSKKKLMQNFCIADKGCHSVSGRVPVASNFGMVIPGKISGYCIPATEFYHGHWLRSVMGKGII